MSRIAASLVTRSPACRERVHLQLCGRPEIALRATIEDSLALAATRIHHPDVYLLDATSCAGGALRFVRRVAALGPRTRTLVLDAICSEARVMRVLEAGGAGCVPSTCTAFELTRAIQAVYAGELWATRRVLASTLRRSLVPTDPAGFDDAEDHLSRREREIVGWMRCGLTNKEIGRKLGISDMTVKTHAQNIFQKLDISGRLGLLGLAQRAREREYA